MAPSILGSITPTTSAVKYFEIRLDEHPLILRGAANTASGILLKGTVVLCLSEQLRIQGIRLRFTGDRRFDFAQASGSGAGYHKIEDQFIKRTWDFEKGGKVLPTDNHEWPFELALPGTISESIEGLSNSWIIYRLKATIERGLMQQNVVARKHVRIIRTLDPSDLELSVGMSVANVWTNKIDYRIETPSKAALFGTIVTVNFRLVPLLKGLRIELVQTRVKESLELKIVENGRENMRWKGFPRTIVDDTYRVAENADAQEVFDDEGFPNEGYIFARSLDLPRNLRECMQSADTNGFKIKHSLEFNIQLRNPDGHLSEVNAAIPLQICISPMLGIDENNNMTTENSRALDAETLNAMAPPGYGEHQMDQLYGSIDLSGFQTPAALASGPGTPFSTRSRAASVDNLALINGMASSSVVANTLRNRLDNLNTTEDSRAIREQVQATASTSDSHGLLRPDVWRRGSGASLSHRTSEEDSIPSGVQTPLQPSMSHVEHSADDLARVPSYTTALQSRPNIPIDNALPNYQTAVRTPNPSPPNQAHLPPRWRSNIHAN